MTWSLLPIRGDLGPFKPIWDALNAELCGANPYFDSGFIEPLLEHFASGRECLCVHTEAGEVDALLIAAPARGGKWSLFVPHQAQIAPIMARRPEVLKSLMPVMPGWVLGMDMLYQDPQASPLAGQGSVLPCVCSPHAHTMGIHIDDAFTDYWSGRSGKLRNNVARRLRRIKDAGIRLRLERLAAPDEMQSAVARFGEMESKGWKGVAGTAVHPENAQGRFYADVMARFALKGMATVYQLYFNDELVAMQLCIASKAMLVLLKTTYDESQAAYSPGRLLLYALLEEEFSRKAVHDVEFYTNADQDQLAWATHDRWISHYMMFRNPFLKSVYQYLKSVSDAVRARSRDKFPID